MTLTRFQKFTLGVAGVTATSIGAMIVVLPHTFFASYGVALSPDPSLLSELRAPGAGLVVFGILMLAGIVHSAWSQQSIVTALIVFLAFPVGRVVGLLVDGIPSGSVMGALIIELSIAGLCLIAFRQRLRLTAAGEESRFAAA